jgi:shikimate kinase
VIESLTQALRRFAPGTSGHGDLTVRSTVPVGRGLKSSSAVSSAVVLAAARATETPVTAVEVARISAQASMVAGVSATGAFDDALAGLTAGVVVTDNARGELLHSFPLDEGLGVAVYVPPDPHPSSPALRAEFEREAVASSRAVRAALDGDWRGAIAQNTELVERVMGYDYAVARSDLREVGALASGVSGLGPALAAFAPTASLRFVAGRLPGTPGEHRVLALSRVRAIPEADP